MKTRILLADDEQTFRLTFTKVLHEEGFDVDDFDWISRCRVPMALRSSKKS
ncbi:MAG: hypothetical protein ACYTBW_01540 [Planctomycetota bacterium]